MYKPVIYMGSDYIYNEKKCDSIEKKIKLKKALKEIENEIKKKGVEVIKPVRRDKNKICRSLWVRDSSFTIHNQVYLMPQMVKSDDRDRSKQIASEVDVIPYVMDGEIVPESVNLDGGDIIIDGKTIFVGKGERNYLPLWMRTAQEGLQELDYVSAIPVCYCLPGTSADIVRNIRNNGFDTKLINFDIDRYVVKRTNNSNVEKYILFANYQFNV